jgi:hypothetical protein
VRLSAVATGVPGCSDRGLLQGLKGREKSRSGGAWSAAVSSRGGGTTMECGGACGPRKRTATSHDGFYKQELGVEDAAEVGLNTGAWASWRHACVSAAARWQGATRAWARCMARMRGRAF